ncbi:MAG TPA: AAA family ATPase [Candidatus Diapherotrites archaeon]|uniref:AAA family ATPase n=1 Tax=Candidatus Iainarchaeum sp. TaxID=3101447 RepID=A0A7J4IXI5_9ARCH|nr:AAA family ATPase [Candidatus Diapherotrites archaeon]
MRICITGTPGVGKTAIAQRLAKELDYPAINEKEFAVKEGLVAAEFDVQSNELEVPLEKLEARLNKMLAKEKNIIAEGHMLCEIKGRFDLVVVLHLDPERLEYRLEQRSYSPEKVQDNVFCEGIDYCSRQAMKNYPKSRVIEVENRKSIKETTELIITVIKSKNAK